MRCFKGRPDLPSAWLLGHTQPFVFLPPNGIPRVNWSVRPKQREAVDTSQKHFATHPKQDSIAG